MITLLIAQHIPIITVTAIDFWRVIHFITPDDGLRGGIDLDVVRDSMRGVVVILLVAVLAARALGDRAIAEVERGLDRLGEDHPVEFGVESNERSWTDERFA